MAAGRTTLGVIGRRVIAAKLAESCFDTANHAKIRAFTRKSHFGEGGVLGAGAARTDLALEGFSTRAFEGALPRYRPENGLVVPGRGGIKRRSLWTVFATLMMDRRIRPQNDRLGDVIDGRYFGICL